MFAERHGEPEGACQGKSLTPQGEPTREGGKRDGGFWAGESCGRSYGESKRCGESFSESKDNEVACC